MDFSTFPCYAPWQRSSWPMPALTRVIRDRTGHIVPAPLGFSCREKCPKHRVLNWTTPPVMSPTASFFKSAFVYVGRNWCQPPSPWSRLILKWENEQLSKAGLRLLHRKQEEVQDCKLQRCRKGPALRFSCLWWNYRATLTTEHKHKHQVWLWLHLYLLRRSINQA